MAKCFSLVFLLASIWTTRLPPVQGSLLVEELSISDPCRIVGVTLLNKKTREQLNFTEAKEACRLMGLTLASKDQVEAAWKSDFQTCSYGWVADKFLVIPRITANPKCGKNGVGVLIWRNSPSQKYKAYCYNSSDTWTNSCFPEIIISEDPMVSIQTETEWRESEREGQGSYRQEAKKQMWAQHPKWPQGSHREGFPSSVSVVLIMCKEESLEEQCPTMYKQTMSLFLPGVPTTLLVLALLFFAAAAGLAVCLF